MTFRQFEIRLSGLSPESVWRRLYEAAPVELTDDQAAAFFRARRG